MHGTSTRLLRYMCLYFKGVALLTPSEVLGMINTLNSQNTYFCLLDSNYCDRHSQVPAGSNTLCCGMLLNHVFFIAPRYCTSSADNVLKIKAEIGLLLICF